MRNTISISVAVLFLGLLVLLTDPFMLWMPMGVQMLVLLLAAVFSGVWAGFVALEHGQDEREAAHVMYAGRVAYLAGLGVLTLALLWQGMTAHAIDVWVAAALGVMVLTKVVARRYLERYG